MDKITCAGPGCPWCILSALVKLPTYIQEAAWRVFGTLGS